MKQLYNDYSHDLAYKAVNSCFNGKWKRRDILSFIEEYAGIDRTEIYNDLLNQSVNVQIEATDAIAYFVDEMISDVIENREIDYIPALKIHERADGMTNKIRAIANLSIPHQLLGHITMLGLLPLFKARILPTQHASIPGHGQVRLKNQISWYLRKKSLNINYFVKTDIVHAYATLKYSDVIKFIEKEIPSAIWILKCLKYLQKLAIDDHLIIGGYLDAWLFNYIMSYSIRYIMKQGSYRRGIFHRYVVRVVTYMDDFCILTETRTAIRKAIRLLSLWFKNRLNLFIKQTSSIVELYSIEDERRAKGKILKAQRGCPGIDMGGFIIHRTYITIRERIFKRIRRCFDRGLIEIKNTGTIQRQRAFSIVSRFGYLKQSTNHYFLSKHNVLYVLEIAKKVVSFWNKRNNTVSKEWLINAIKRRKSIFSTS